MLCFNNGLNLQPSDTNMCSLMTFPDMIWKFFVLNTNKWKFLYTLISVFRGIKTLILLMKAVIHLILKTKWVIMNNVINKMLPMIIHSFNEVFAKIDWLIGKIFTPYRQYFSQLVAGFSEDTYPMNIWLY